MQTRRLVAFAVALVAFSAAPARADGFVTPFVGFNYGADSPYCATFSACDDKRANWGVAVGATSGIFGVEEEFAYAPSFFGAPSDANNAVLTLMSNFLVVIPAGPVHPYGLVGIGLVRPHTQLSTSNLTSQNTLGWDIGGGVNVYFTHTVGVRGDVRHFRTLQDVTIGGIFTNSPLDFWRASAGVTFRF